MAQHELLVKLGLQSDSFSRNLKNVNNQLKLTDAEFKKLESSTKNFGSSQKDLSKKLESLKKTKEQLTAKTILYNNKIKETNEKIFDATVKHESLTNKLAKERDKLQELEATTGKTNAKYKKQKEKVEKLQQQYDKSTRNLENFNLSLQRHEIELAKTETEINKLDRAIKDLSFQKATLHLDQLGQKLESTSKKFDVLSQKLGAAGRTLTAGVTAPIIGAGATVIKFGAEFDASMSKVSAASRASGDELKALEMKAREMGKATSFTAKEAADGLSYMALAGWDTKEMLTGIEPVLRLAEAGGKDLAETSDLVTDSMSSLGLTTDDLAGYLDKVALSSSISNAEIDQMLRAYNQVGGSLSRFNVPLEESGALLGVLSNRGLKAEQAGRALSSIMINLIKPTGDSAKALADLNVSAYDSKGKFKGVEVVLKELAAELNKTENGVAKYTDKQKDMFLSMIGGKTQIRTLDALLAGVTETTESGKTEFQELREELINSEGALEEMSKTMKDNLMGDWEKFTSMVGELALTINDILRPKLREIVQGMTELVEKFVNLDQGTKETIIKMALMAAAVGPALLAFSGFAKVISILTGGVSTAISMFLKIGKTIGDVFYLVKGGIGPWSALSTVIAGFPAIVALVVAALAGVAAAFGENEAWLARIQEKWGLLGVIIGGVCESIAGIVQMTVGNIAIGLGTLGKVILKAVTFQWDEIDDVVREGASKVAQNSNKAWDNMTMSSTAAITKMRNMSSDELQGLVDDMQFILDKLPNVTFDSAERSARLFTEQFKNLDNDAIAILSSTSNSMNMLFRGIHENMSNDEAVAQYTKNLESLARTGGVNADQLRAEIEKSLNLINNNMVDSGDRLAREAESAMEQFGLIASQGVDKAAGQIANHLSMLSETSINNLKGMGVQWGLVFDGIKTDGTMSVEDMARKIEMNILQMAQKNPNYIKNLQEEFKTYFDKLPKDAQDNMLALQEAVEEGAQGAVDKSAGKGKLIEENLEFDATTNAKEELNNVQVAFNESGEPIVQAAANAGSKAEEGWKQGLEGLDQATAEKLYAQATNIAENGEISKQAMSNNAVGSIEQFITTWDANSGRINDSVNATFDNINRLTLLKWGNTTKGLSEVNRWLGIVSEKAVSTKGALTPLTALKWGNTTNGLSEVNRWLGNVTQKANVANNALTPLTALKWGNTTKGLSEVNKWLTTVTTTSNTTTMALKAIVAVTYGAVTKGLSEVDRWLNSIRASASSVRTMLVNMASVRFGGLTSSLSEVNRWLTTVSRTASSTRSSLNSVAKAKASVRMIEPVAEADKIPILSQEDFDLSKYDLRSASLKSRSNPLIDLASNKNNSTLNEVKILSMLEAIVNQNKAIVSRLEKTSSNNTLLNVENFNNYGPDNIEDLANELARYCKRNRMFNF